MTVLVLSTESFSQTHVVSNNIPTENLNDTYDDLKSVCVKADGKFSGSILDNGDGTGKILWGCYFCESERVKAEIQLKKSICKATCFSGNYIKCRDYGDIYDLDDCDYNMPIYYKEEDPDTHHCPYKDDSSSSSEHSSSSDASSSSSSEEPDENEDDDFSSSGGSGGGDCAGVGSSCPLSSNSSEINQNSNRETIVFKLYAGCPGCLPCSVSGNTLSCNCFSASVSVSGSSANYNRSGYNYSMPLSSDSSKLSSCWMEAHYSPEYSGDCYAIACDFISIENSSSSDNSSSSSSSSSSSKQSSSSETQSSSTAISSSSTASNSSSSSTFEQYSSSIAQSSSSVIPYSSSSNIDSDFYDCQVCKPFVPGPDVSYDPEEVFYSGLNNMEQGKCYGLNPDRGTQYGWINNNAQDSWWWIEVPCDGSKPIEPITPNGCKNNKRGENMVYTANDCFNDGLDNMEPGKCYGLNPDRGTQYGWINNNAQDSWWWIEVPCGENSLLKKNIFEIYSEGSEKTSEYNVDSNYIWHNKSRLFYDAAGRKTQANSETRRFLFLPKKTFKEERKPEL